MIARRPATAKRERPKKNNKKYANALRHRDTPVLKISLDITVGNEVQSGFDATKRYPPTLMTLTLLRLLIAILLAGYIGAEWVKNLHRGVV